MSDVDSGGELVRYHRWLRIYGLNDSHSGNASIRRTDRMVITPTGCCADTLTPENLVETALTALPADGASLDAALHLAIYAARPDVKAIIHSHGPHAIAMTLDGRDFVPIDFEGQYYFKRVAVVDIPYENYVDDSPSSVAGALAESNVVIVRGHGIYACGETLDLAYKWTCSVESAAKIAWLDNLSGDRTHRELNWL
ncbi:MAG: class II aldolase/adducin family protein [Gammaproteobacteria bacterium]